MRVIVRIQTRLTFAISLVFGRKLSVLQFTFSLVAIRISTDPGVLDVMEWKNVYLVLVSTDNILGNTHTAVCGTYHDHLQY